MDKRKRQIVEPEEFDPDAPSPAPEPLPGEPEPVPSYPGDDDDSDDEREDENEAVPDDEDREQVTPSRRHGSRTPGRALDRRANDAAARCNGKEVRL